MWGGFRETDAEGEDEEEEDERERIREIQEGRCPRRVIV